ncbi:MAG: T9SS type A sorting domain-containing protein [Cytophagaceae bacterium]
MRYFFLMLLLVLSLNSMAQMVISPLGYDVGRENGENHNTARISSEDKDTLNLPFFEEFSQKSIYADTNKWMPGSGVFINSNYPLSPPSYNVATFDGMDAFGKPYNTGSNINLEGWADRLVSRPIDLSEIPENYDSLYFSFFWQAAGLGEKPDPGDFLILEFKNDNNVWETAWQQRGEGSVYADLGFKYQEVKITEPRFLFKGFQFRFSSHGRLSGNFDVWNVDYIYFNKSRAEGNMRITDITISKPPSSILKNYFSMPIKQFIANYKNEITDSIQYNVNSMFNPFDPTRPDDIVHVSTDTTSILTEDHNIIIEKIFPSIEHLYRQEITKSWDLDPNDFTSFLTSEHLILKTHIELNGGDSDTIITGIDFRINDTLTRHTIIGNYYAYDDGSAEFGAGLENEYGGKIAYEFNLNVEDTITAIDIYFPRMNRNLNNFQLRLLVWKEIELNGEGENILYGGKDNDHIIPLIYGNWQNHYIRYKLREPVVTSGKFYIGFQQFTLFQVPVGFDVNTNSADKIFYKKGNTWHAYDKEPGSLMMRPVFGDPSIVLSTKKPVEEAKENFPSIPTPLTIYPNPTSGMLYFQEPVKDVVVMDLSGRKVMTHSFSVFDTEFSINMESLQDGMYILQINDGKALFVRKVILRK